MKVNFVLLVIGVAIMIGAGYLMAKDWNHASGPVKTTSIDRPPGLQGPIEP